MKNSVQEFFIQESHEQAYVLGFFAADGNMHKNKRGGCYISFQSKDEQIISDITRVCGSSNTVSKRKNISTNTYFYRLQIGSKSIFEHLHTIGFGTSKTKHLPFPNIQDIFMHDLIRGYFDGDGNVWYGEIHKERKTSHMVLRVAFTSCSKEFLNHLQNYLSFTLKTGGSLISFKNDTYFRLQYSTRDTLKIYNYMYNTSTPLILLKRKKEAFDGYIQNLRS